MNSKDRHHQPDPEVVKIKLLILATFVLTGLILLIHYSPYAL